MSYDNGQQRGQSADEPMRTRGSVPPPQFPAYQPQPPKKKHTVRNVFLGIGGGFVALIVIGAVASGGKNTSTSTATSSTTGAAPGAAPAAAPATSAAAAPTAQAVPAKTVVLKLSGSGTKNTKTFTTGADWSIAYTFDCSSFGSQGNFQVMVYTDGQIADAPVNALSANGNDTTYEHSAAGSHYLEVNSECSWTVTVTDGDGGQ